MKTLKTFFIISVITLFSSAFAIAGDFDWMKNFNIRAEADPSGFRVRLATRFKVGNVEIDAVLKNVTNPADAYMIFRYGEMSSRSTSQVMERYRNKKGWGVLAKSLGIKAGSQEFHSLKRNHDMGEISKKMKHPSKNKGKGNKGKKKV
ncbi:MAG: hypothetical protein ABFS35_23995 [Bacteroidota bacterium]